jgi:hypothetical protein
MPPSKTEAKMKVDKSDEQCNKRRTVVAITKYLGNQGSVFFYLCSPAHKNSNAVGCEITDFT